jgi:hypothetical protein
MQMQIMLLQVLVVCEVIDVVMRGQTYSHWAYV